MKSIAVDYDFLDNALCYNFSLASQLIVLFKGLYRLSLGGYKRLNCGLMLFYIYLLLKGAWDDS